MLPAGVFQQPVWTGELVSRILAVNTKRRETGRLFTVAGGMGAEGPLGKAVGFVFVTLVVILVIIWAVES